MASIDDDIAARSMRAIGLLLAALVPLLTNSPTVAAVEPLSTAAAIALSAPAGADAPPPVLLEAIVTYRDAAGTIFLMDDTGATFIAADKETPPLPPGERVRVAGMVHRGLFINGIRLPRIERLGPGPLPDAKPITPQQMAAGGRHYEWVSLEGVGRRWRATGSGGGTLDLNIGGGVVEVRIERRPPGPDAPHWIGARLQVKGIAAGEINDRRQLIRPYLLVPTADDVAVIEPAPPDPFALPDTPFSTLGRGEPTDLLERVTGVAVTAPRGHQVFLHDGSAGLCVLLADGHPDDTAPIHPGDRVEAVGFAEPGTFASRLAEARVRTVAVGEPAVPLRPTAIDLRTGCDAQLVELEMTVIDREDRDDGTILRGEFQGIPLRVVTTESLPAAIMPAASVRVTAPCLVTKTSESRYQLQAAAYDILPARAADVVMLRRPGWWTARRLGLLLAASLAAGAAALGWVVLLRRQVRRQLAVIEEKIQAEAVAEERRRIAREFHDSLEQDLSGLALRIDSATAGTADPDARRLMERQREIVARLRDETRQYIWDLRDPARLRGGLADRVAALVAELRDVHGTPIMLEPTAPLPPLDPEAIHHLLQMLREAVNNAARHAHAGRIAIALRAAGGGVMATVTDDGVGFEPTGDRPAAGHFGLRGLTERARRIGAEVALDSRSGTGTTVTIRVPARPGEKRPDSQD